MRALLLLLGAIVSSLAHGTEIEGQISLTQLPFRYSQTTGVLHVAGVDLTPSIEFYLPTQDCPECNSLWARMADDKQTAFIWVENNQMHRQGWLVNLNTGRILLFTTEVHGRHYSPKFTDASNLYIEHAGMGYRQRQHIFLNSGQWASELLAAEYSLD